VFHGERRRIAVAVAPLQAVLRVVGALLFGEMRGEMRGASVIGQELNQSGAVVYDYREYTIGFAFYRSLGS
jgi:hypothetical protein